jgi:hypothetical protein
MPKSTKADLERLHADLVQELKDLLGQSNNDTIVGWSINDCLNNPRTKTKMEAILVVRKELETRG